MAVVPYKLRLRNFLCYQDNCPTLDLSQIRVACLCGDNGHGKSALLDAMTWAVWGQARARSDDDLIHLGRVDMEVEFEFRVGETHYRTLRKRRKGTVNSPGRVVLEFQVWSNDAWKPLTGTTVRETQARIIEAVRLDYDTFRNSAFLVQGRADEFTLKAPGERKKVLGDILGLGAYDEYEARSREERRRWDTEARRLEAVLGQYAEELKRQPAYEAEKRQHLEDLAAVDADLRESRELLETLRKAEQAQRLLQSQIQVAEREQRQAAERVERTRAELLRQREIIADRSTILNRAEDIGARFTALGAARVLESEQSRRLAQTTELHRKESDAEAEIAREATLLESRIAALAREAERLRGGVERQTEIAAERAAVTVERAALDRVEEHVESLLQELQEQTNAVGRLQAANQRLLDDMNDLKHKQSELVQGGATCPICRTELGEEGKRRISETYDHEGGELAAQYRGNRAQREATEARATALQTQVRQMQEQLARQRAAFERRLATLERDERDAADAGVALPPVEAELGAARDLLESGGYASQARGQLEQVRTQLTRIDYDKNLHREAREDVQHLQTAEAEHTALQRAEEAMAAAHDAAARMEADLGEWQQQLEQADTRAGELKQHSEGSADLQQQLARAEFNVNGLEDSERRLRQALGAAEQRLDDCRRFQRLHAVAQAERERARLKQQIYEDLAVAFGRRGAQALIIDSVVPEIEEEANRLLARMSSGRMSVAIKTQRLTSKQAVAETLDIEIADELGTRPYELFSGGEAFRINLALRIALSKLLARRAGAPLPTLIIDEGFGTQDASGRERLIEAMNAVSHDFECLIVITHLDELRDQFDTQIRVEKRDTGSIVTIV